MKAVAGDPAAQYAIVLMFEKKDIMDNPDHTKVVIQKYGMLAGNNSESAAQALKRLSLRGYGGENAEFARQVSKNAALKLCESRIKHCGHPSKSNVNHYKQGRTEQLRNRQSKIFQCISVLLKKRPSHIKIQVIKYLRELSSLPLDNPRKEAAISVLQHMILSKETDIACQKSFVQNIDYPN